MLVIVLGWAADHRVVEHIAPSGYDVLCIYDFREIEPLDAALLEPYRTKTLFAWSFGVWAAEQIFSGVKFDGAVAFNGTPYPVHEQYGIEPRRFLLTLRSIKAQGSEKFNRRTYGQYYDRFAPVLSPRGIAADTEELERLSKFSAAPYTPAIEWDKAVVGERDEIFPPENMSRFWQSLAVSLPLPHYPFGDLELIKGELVDR